MLAQTIGETPVLVVDLITTDESKKFAPAASMATAIIELIQKNGGCLPQDLNERGFTPNEVSQYWPMAQSLATVELNLMCDNPTKLKSIIRSR